MNKTVVLGRLEETELQSLTVIAERKTALEELLQIIPVGNDLLYEKVLNDYMNTKRELTDWWKTTAEKYHWAYSSSDSWQVDFESSQVSLISF